MRHVEPARLDIVEVSRDMSVAELARELPAPAPVELIALLNGVDRDETLHAGALAKRIVGGDRALLSLDEGAARRLHARSDAHRPSRALGP